MKPDTPPLPVERAFIPFCTPSISDAEIDEVVDTLSSGWLTTGPKTRQFEAALAEYTGAKHVVALSSCTAALHLALLSLDIGPGDEVITTPLTFCSTVNSILHTGADAVIVDIDPDTFNIDPDALAAAITPRTKALMVVDYAGHPVDHDRIQALAEKHDLPVIEDAAHAIGARHNGRPIGSISTLTAFSFYPIKNMTTGEGGALLTDDEALADKARMLSLHGMDNTAWKRYEKTGSWYYEVVALGFKYNMTDLQAAIGLQQLQRLDGFIDCRETYAQLYNSSFDQTPLIGIPANLGDIRHARHLYPIQLDPAIDRARFIERMKEEQIGCTVNFIPVHLHPYYRETFGYHRGMFPVAERVYDRLVSLPLNPALSPADVDYIAQTAIRIAREEAANQQGITTCKVA